MGTVPAAGAVDRTGTARLRSPSGEVAVEVVASFNSSRHAGLGVAPAGQQPGRCVVPLLASTQGTTTPDLTAHQLTSSPTITGQPFALDSVSGEPLRTFSPRGKSLPHHRPPAARPWLAPVAGVVAQCVTGQAQRCGPVCGSSGSAPSQASGVCSRKHGPYRVSGNHGPAAHGPPPLGRTLGTVRP